MIRSLSSQPYNFAFTLRILVGVGIGLPAWAQDEKAGAAVPGSAPLEASPPIQMEPWGSDHRWSYGRLRSAVYSLSTTSDDELMVILEDGSVWRGREDRSWTLLLPSAELLSEETDSEELLLETESSLEDFLEQPDPVELEAEEDVEFISDPTEQDLDSLDLGLQMAGEDGDPAISSGPNTHLWVESGGSGSVLVSRADGRWLSADLGQNWVQLAYLPPVHAVLELAEGGVVLGTDEGLWIRDEGGDWDPLGGILAGSRVQSLAHDGETLWVGTSRGLYQGTLQDQAWKRAEAMSLAERSVRSILVDSSWEGGLWLATDQGIYRSDDGGRTSRLAGRNPLSDTLELVGLDRPGHLIAVGDGIWESVDGGVRWQSISVGLSGPEQWGLARSEMVLWVGGIGGVARLGRPELVKPAGEMSTQHLPEVGDVVEHALSREGLNINPLIIQRYILAALVAPQLSITGGWQRDQSMDADYGARTNSRSDDVAWEITARVCYGQCGGPSYGLGSDAYSAAGDLDLLADAGELDVAVVGEKVYVLEDSSGYSAIAANVSERVSRYRRSVADAVTDLYFARIMLTYENRGVETRPIQEQVALDLEIQEVTARLDAYTDGYFSRALAAQ